MKNKMIIALACFAITAAASTAFIWQKKQEKKATLNIAKIFQKVSDSAIASAHAAASQNAIDRLVLIKSLYFFINGGADGTWPDGATSALTGANAPSDRMQNGYLGIVNEILGPNGVISDLLVSAGYTSCASIPSAQTDLGTFVDPDLGTLTASVQESTRAIPVGMQNTGTFERRFLIQQGSTDILVMHLSCTGTHITALIRGSIELDDAGQSEDVEILVEGTETGSDMYLEMIAQNTNANEDDIAMYFQTDDGDTYNIMVAFTSGMADAGGNGPAHVLAAVTGVRSTNKATLHAMGGNANVSAVTTSADLASLPFDATQTPDLFAVGNQFCIDTTTADDTTACPDIFTVATPKISGLAAWTMNGIYDVREGNTNVDAISTF